MSRSRSCLRLVLGSLLLLWAGAAAGRPDWVIKGEDQDVLQDCAGANVVISGSKNVIKLTGTCPVVTVNASENTITIEKVRTIVIKGHDNKITYKKALKGARPKVTDRGKNNEVRKFRKEKPPEGAE